VPSIGGRWPRSRAAPGLPLAGTYDNISQQGSAAVIAGLGVLAFAAGWHLVGMDVFRRGDARAGAREDESAM